MVAPSLVSKDVKDIGFSYTTEEEVISFRTKVDISSWEDENMFFLEVCTPSERDTMANPHDSPSPNFYFYLPLIKDMRLFPTFLLLNSKS